MTTSTPVLGFAAFSGTGKTTLLKRLIPVLRSSGLRLGVIKHAHHNFDIDIPGKDSYELRNAGADQVIISSKKRFVKISELHVEKTLQQCLKEIDVQMCDLVLVEGYKRSEITKIELHRPALGFPLLFKSDDSIVAIATDSDLQTESRLPVLNLNKVDQVAQFITENLNLFTQLRT